MILYASVSILHRTLKIKNPSLFLRNGVKSFPDHLTPSITVKGLKDILSWPLFDWSLPIYIEKVKSIRFLAFVDPNEV
jgi:hypothetical protein